MKRFTASRPAALGRAFLVLALSITLATTLGVDAPAQAQQQAQQQPLRIGIIGTGRIGGALARHWVAAGHEVFMSSRHPEELEPLAAELGPRAHVGLPCEAAAFGPIVLVSIPYGAMPQIGADCAEQLDGKIVLDTSNPSEGRDGAMALEAMAIGGIAAAM